MSIHNLPLRNKNISDIWSCGSLYNIPFTAVLFGFCSSLIVTEGDACPYSSELAERAIPLVFVSALGPHVTYGFMETNFFCLSLEMAIDRRCHDSCYMNEEEGKVT